MLFRVGAANGRNNTSGNAAFLARLVVAVAQAAVLYFLTESATVSASWPATAPAVFEPLLLAAIFVPLLAMLGVGRIPARLLAAWVMVAALVTLRGFRKSWQRKRAIRLSFPL